VLISPHAGYIYSGRVAAAGYRRLALVRERITRVVLLGPSHFVGFHGLAAASADGWQTPLGSVPVDRPLVVRLIEAKLIEVLDAAHATVTISQVRHEIAARGNQRDPRNLRE
jgi:AmmeMemoRadiSam system protein B